jgi:hypothetical protein
MIAPGRGIFVLGAARFGDSDTFGYIYRKTPDFTDLIGSPVLDTPGGVMASRRVVRWPLAERPLRLPSRGGCPEPRLDAPRLPIRLCICGNCRFAL